MKSIHTRLLSLAYTFVLGTLAAGASCQAANIQRASAQIQTHQLQAAATTADYSAGLDSRRLYALGMIETGNDDRAIGLAGEISRYQLSPSVWKSYSKSREYQDTDVAVTVARQHWNYLAAYFKEKTGRAPTDFDMYVLWNTRYGYYEHRDFSKRHLASVVMDRAQRFVNLVNRKMG